MSTDLDALAALLSGRPAVSLTGAGCSTESGIPDYRGTGTSPESHDPIRYREFVSDPGARARYWSRSAVGWTRVDRARPNPAHRALARMEREGALRGVITQNVDGLHQAGGSRRVVELHGSLDRVVCLECGAAASRAAVQRRILSLNPRWRRTDGRLLPDGDVELTPDGDAEVPDGLADDFAVPGCRRCGGVLKPDVVFFGESVPRERAEEAWRLFEEGEALLVAGSSLAVWSGFRFARRAAEEGLPVAIVNLGPTRGDDLAAVRAEGRVGDLLPRLADALLGARRRPA